MLKGEQVVLLTVSLYCNGSWCATGKLNKCVRKESFGEEDRNRTPFHADIVGAAISCISDASARVRIHYRDGDRTFRCRRPVLDSGAEHERPSTQALPGHAARDLHAHR